ncbi:unnamed protein product [Acanthoscelides obtectus]|uniref:Transmembrane inner ear expressed protein n=1 Tax=Acanthoscelides obtectus TaxID=200917 RepID=A0A9P0K0N6_ACAOB|nr:unnamed protein product [Acanthoscelides obtectus]CAK1669764.1 hypothetical protein AOBTE_LOCUS27235 [Acanthoscelides obtectus]
MATFYANPEEENELWIERAAIKGLGFRIWHYIFFAFAAVTVLIVLICCCVKIRVPRTKQEIEGDYKRKKLAEKFRQRLKMIRNQDMGTIDLERALEIILDDCKNDNGDIQHPSTQVADESSCAKAQPQQPLKKVVNAVKASMNVKATNA